MTASTNAATITLTYRFDVAADVAAAIVADNDYDAATGELTARFYGTSPLGEFVSKHRMPAVYADDANTIHVAMPGVAPVASLAANTTRDSLIAAAELNGWTVNADYGVDRPAISAQRDAVNVIVWFTRRGAILEAHRYLHNDAQHVDRMNAGDKGKRDAVFAWLADGRAQHVLPNAERNAFRVGDRVSHIALGTVVSDAERGTVTAVHGEHYATVNWDNADAGIAAFRHESFLVPLDADGAPVDAATEWEAELLPQRFAIGERAMLAVDGGVGGVIVGTVESVKCGAVAIRWNDDTREWLDAFALDSLATVSRVADDELEPSDDGDAELVAGYVTAPVTAHDCAVSACNASGNPFADAAADSAATDVSDVVTAGFSGRVVWDAVNGWDADALDVIAPVVPVINDAAQRRHAAQRELSALDSRGRIADGTPVAFVWHVTSESLTGYVVNSVSFNGQTRYSVHVPSKGHTYDVWPNVAAYGTLRVIDAADVVTTTRNARAGQPSEIEIALIAYGANDDGSDKVTYQASIFGVSLETAIARIRNVAERDGYRTTRDVPVCGPMAEATAGDVLDADGNTVGLWRVQVLERVPESFRVAHIDVDTGDTVYSDHAATWSDADAAVRRWQRNAIPAEHVR